MFSVSSISAQPPAIPTPASTSSYLLTRGLAGSIFEVSAIVPSYDAGFTAGACRSRNLAVSAPLPGHGRANATRRGGDDIDSDDKGDPITAVWYETSLGGEYMATLRPCASPVNGFAEFASYFEPIDT